MQQEPASRYRLAADKAAVLRVNPPVNMNVMEAAAYVGVSPRKLRDLIQSGRLKCARLGSKLILRREYLDDLLRVT